MNLQNRIELLQKLKNYLLDNDDEWQEIKVTATAHNGWFIPAFIDRAVQNGWFIPAFIDRAVQNICTEFFCC